MSSGPTAKNSDGFLALEKGAPSGQIQLLLSA